MQDNNNGVMPEYQVLHDHLSNLINLAKEDTTEHGLGVLKGLNLARASIKDSFEWAYRGGFSGYVNALDYPQICNLIEIANRLKSEKDAESKKWIHQVCLETGVKNFREDELPQAIDCYHQELQRVAKDEPGDIQALRMVKLQHFKERESEYEEYFDRGPK